MSRRRDGWSDLVWAVGIIWAGVQTMNALRSFQSSHHAPRQRAQRDQQLNDIRDTLRRIERKL